VIQPLASPTATLLRLSPNRGVHLRRLAPLRVSSATSDAPHFRGLTGGVYKAQQHTSPRYAESAITSDCRLHAGELQESNPNWARFRYRSPTITRDCPVCLTSLNLVAITFYYPILSICLLEILKRAPAIGRVQPRGQERRDRLAWPKDLARVSASTERRARLRHGCPLRRSVRMR
jgi:hypothetical protein